MTDYFSSDWHLFHTKIAELRGLEGPSEIDWENIRVEDVASANEDAILEELSRLKNGDRLFFLGDLTIGNSAHEDVALNYLAYCRPELHLITGNHDSIHPFKSKSLKDLWKWRETFNSISPVRSVKIAGERGLLCHYPYEGDHTKEERDTQWRPKDCGELVIHGHTHSPDKISRTSLGTLQVHVGWDAWGKFPSKEELTELIKEERKKEKGYEVRQSPLSY